MKVPSKESAVEVQQIIVVAFDIDKIEKDGDDDAHNQCDKDDQLLLLNIRTSEQKEFWTVHLTLTSAELHLSNWVDMAGYSGSKNRDSCKL